MALDGLSNQSVGIYRSKDPSKTTDKLTAKSKQSAEFYLSEIEDSAIIQSIDPDGKGTSQEQEQQKKNELVSPKKESLMEEEVFEVTIDEGEGPIELSYTLKFNHETKMIEMINVKTDELIEAVHPDELLKVLYKAKNFSGMFVDREV